MGRMILWMCICFLAISSTAQNVNWYVKSEKKVSVNSSFQIEFVLENAKGSNFEAPDFGSLQVLGGPMYSSSTQIINGNSSSSISYVYEVAASKPGQFTIGAAAITVGRQKVKTKPYTIEVIKGNNIAGMLSSEDGDMILKMELSDSSAFVGQQVLLNYVLYYSGSVRFNGLVKEDEFKGIYAQRIQGASRTKTIVQNGKQYKSTTLSSLALFPQKSGDYVISPCVAKIGIPIQSNRSRSFFSFQQYKNQILEADPITLTVKELPGESPENFSGAVGEFEVQTGVNTTKTSTDDAIVMHLAVRGDGDIRLLDAPNLKFDDRWEVYEPTIVEEKEFIQNDRIFNFKKFEYLLLPKSTGQLKIQPSFTYFSLDSMQYQTIEVKPTYIEVTQGNRKVLFDDSKLLSSKEIAPFRTVDSLTMNSNQNPFVHPIYLGSLGLLLLSGIGLFIKKKKSDEYLALSPEERKRLQAENVAKSKLSKARDHSDAKETRLFYDEISNAMNGFVADKFNIPHSKISKTFIKQELALHYPNTNIADRYFSLLNQCELALFAGQTGDAKMDEVYKTSVDLISAMEQQETK